MILWGDNEYEGPLNEAGEPHGHGKLTGKPHTLNPVTTIGDGATYTGDFVDGVRTGKGILTWPDGRRYEGDFIEGVITGQGILHYADGGKYEGQLLRGSYRGQGKLTLANGDVKEGTFSGAELKEGIIRYADGGKMAGIFDIYGTIIKIWPNGDRYEGQVLEREVFYGRGKLIVNGEISDGYFWAGKFIGQKPNKELERDITSEPESFATISKYKSLLAQSDQPSIKSEVEPLEMLSDPIGDNIYEGEMNEAGSPHGKGKLTGKARSSKTIFTSIGLNNTYVGNFKNGKMEGQGKLDCLNPEYVKWGIFDPFTYEGGFVGGKPQGQGILTIYDTKRIVQYEGEFIHQDKLFLSRVPMTQGIIRYSKKNAPHILDGGGYLRR